MYIFFLCVDGVKMNLADDMLYKYLELCRCVCYYYFFFFNNYLIQMALLYITYTVEIALGIRSEKLKGCSIP